MFVTKVHTDAVETMYNPRINLRTLLSMQLFTYEIMSENIGLTNAKDCDAWSL